MDSMNKHYQTRAASVMAKPMTRQEYNDFRNWTLPIDEDGTDEGYMVTHMNGHINWHPLDVFNSAYRCMDTPKQRVELELDELVKRINDLSVMLIKDRPVFISEEMWALLPQQLHAMNEYRNVLQHRLTIWID